MPGRHNEDCLTYIDILWKISWAWPRSSSITVGMSTTPSYTPWIESSVPSKRRTPSTKGGPLPQKIDQGDCTWST